MSARLNAPFLDLAPARRVVAALEAVRPGSVRFVGGCVRNAILGAPVDDLDIATPLTPGQVLAAGEAAGLAAHPTGIAHGTITLVADRMPFEVTTLRRDVSTDGRRATVAFTEDWDEDARRRDFRLNALYLEPDGTLHDPTGGGLEDARAGRVVFIGDADTRLREDFLRLLRFFRFSAWYGKGAFDAGGLAACARHVEGLASLSAERVWKEYKKLLGAEDPRHALAAMDAIGALAAIAPEADEGGRARVSRLIAQDEAHFFAAEPMQRAAALLPDDPEIARAFARRLKLSNEERARLVGALDPAGQRLVSYMSLRELRRALYRLGKDVGRDRARLAWAASDDPRTDMQWRGLLALIETWTRPSFPLTGDDVIAAGVRPGERVGLVMREVEAWWIDADFPNDELALVERLKAVAQALG
jgi:poly(A) polymerase